jgi:hypothetical protein
MRWALNLTTPTEYAKPILAAFETVGSGVVGKISTVNYFLLESCA